MSQFKSTICPQYLQIYISTTKIDLRLTYKSDIVLRWTITTYIQLAISYNTLRDWYKCPCYMTDTIRWLEFVYYCTLIWSYCSVRIFICPLAIPVTLILGNYRTFHVSPNPFHIWYVDSLLRMKLVTWTNRCSLCQHFGQNGGKPEGDHNLCTKTTARKS